MLEPRPWDDEAPTLITGQAEAVGHSENNRLDEIDRRVETTEQVDRTVVLPRFAIPERRHPVRRLFFLVPLALLAAATTRATNHLPTTTVVDRLVDALGAGAFLVAALCACTAGGNLLHHVMRPRLGSAHAGALRVAAVLAGGVIALLLTLKLLAIPIRDLVLGGAVTGVVVGVAAQQTLANVFAGILLLLVRPFSVGEMVQLCSGQLGGPVTGRVLDVGLAYVRLQSDAGPVAVPNSQALNAVVRPPDYRADTETPPVLADQPFGGRTAGG